MHVHWLQHARHEGLGSIEPWLKQRGHTVTRTCFPDDDELPPLERVDWLIVMGGPMNIYAHERFPWLVPEKQFIRDACVMNKRILGLCLGAQLIADVLGGPVTQNPETEIGWFAVGLTGEGRKSRYFEGFPDAFTAFHWHGDTFAIPPGCASLASSQACRNQAFSYGKRIVGLQFHLEVMQPDARLWLDLAKPKPGGYIQPAAEILRDPARFEENNRLMEMLLEKLESA